MLAHGDLLDAAGNPQQTDSMTARSMEHVDAGEQDLVTTAPWAGALALTY
jgi:hypothetical protein